MRCEEKYWNLVEARTIVCRAWMQARKERPWYWWVPFAALEWKHAERTLYRAWGHINEQINSLEPKRDKRGRFLRKH